jgi:hypothetical protein
MDIIIHYRNFARASLWGAEGSSDSEANEKCIIILRPLGWRKGGFVSRNRDFPNSLRIDDFGMQKTDTFPLPGTTEFFINREIPEIVSIVLPGRGRRNPIAPGSGARTGPGQDFSPKILVP